MKRDSLDKIAVFGHFGRGNLGDEATLAEVLRNIELLRPSAEVLALTIDTEDAKARHEVDAVPIRRLPKPSSSSSSRSQAQETANNAPQQASAKTLSIKQVLKSIPLVAPMLRGIRNTLQSFLGLFSELLFLARSYGRLRGTNMMIVAGGGQLGDYFEGAWGYPYTIWKWVVLARLRGARVVYLSAGAGPITTFLGTRFLRWGLRRSNYRSFRDDHSRRLIEGIGQTHDNHVFPDMVHGMPLPPNFRTPQLPIRTVGINPLPYHDPRYWAVDDSEVYEDYVKAHAEFAIHLLQRGLNVLLFPTQMRADPPVIRDIIAQVKARSQGEYTGSISQVDANSFDELFDAISKTDAVVASRFHGIVFSLLTGRPTLALSYDPKSRALMEDVGLGEYVKEIGDVDSGWLINGFETLSARADEIARQIAAVEERYRQVLNQQYDQVFGESYPGRDEAAKGVEGQKNNKSESVSSGVSRLDIVPDSD